MNSAARRRSSNGNVLHVLAEGLAEATAKNEAMEQSMRDAANDGLRRGRAEYARNQTNTSSANGYSPGIIIEDRPTAQSFTPEAPSVSQATSTPMPVLIGRWGRTCEDALKSGGPRFVEVPGNREIDSSGCLVRGYYRDPTFEGGNSAQ